MTDQHIYLNIIDSFIVVRRRQKRLTETLRLIETEIQRRFGDILDDDTPLQLFQGAMPYLAVVQPVITRDVGGRAQDYTLPTLNEVHTGEDVLAALGDWLELPLALQVWVVTQVTDFLSISAWMPASDASSSILQTR